MITKGIVEQIDRNNPYTAKVRIPVFNKAQGVVGATPTNQLYTASICCLPNCNPNIKVGDVVYVSFEDNYIDKPIILGHLYNGVSNLNTTVGLKTDSIESTVTARLPADTYIGNTTPNDFVNLQNTRSNLQGQIDLLSQNANSLSNYVDVVTAPKPWIGNATWIKVIRRNNSGQVDDRYPISCVVALATINLLYIQLDNVFGGDSYGKLSSQYFNFEIDPTTSVNTEDYQNFVSYFQKKKTIIATQVINISTSSYLSDEVSNVRIVPMAWTVDSKNIDNGFCVTGSPSASFVFYQITGGVTDLTMSNAPIGFLFALSD